MSTATLTGWNDDNRRKALAALIASLFIHLLIILSVTVVLSMRPPLVVPQEDEPPPVELTLVAPPEEQPKQKPAYVATSESQRADRPPEDSVFESDKDTHAASPLPAEGDAPVPTQDGREIAALTFEDKEHTPGPVARPSTPAAQPRQEIRPQPETPEAQPKEETAEPKKTAEAESKEKPVEAEPKPQKAEVEPKMTLRPSTQLALLEPPKPQSPPRPKTAAAKAAPQQQQQPPQAVQPPGYQPQTRVTRIRGNISNRGRASVSATATPLGRYKKMLSDAIGSRWYYYVTDQISLLNVGTVEVRFVVRQSGKVERVQVLRNSSNESFAACTVRAIMEAEIPPIPKELVPMLEGGRIEIEYSFTILSN